MKKPGRGTLLHVVVIATLGVAVVSCTSSSPDPETVPPLVLPADAEDQRGRFREIFCAVLEERGPTAPDYRSCEEALTRIGHEAPGSGRTVELGKSKRRLVAAVVFGLGWGCFENWLDLKGTTVDYLRQFGYELVAIDVDALSGTTTNARQIRDAIMAMEAEGPEPRIVLIGYSKGVPDIFEAVVSYPEIRERIAAVVSAAGAVGGSPVADEVTQSKLELLTNWPGAECSSGDGGGIESLRPATRRAWLADNPLPRDFPYYSLVTYPQPDKISPALKPSYKHLRRVDPRNDGMMLFDDQLVPGSSFVACVNADHWAVSVPIARSHANIAKLFADDNDYPREALLEAVLRFVEEDLSRPAR
jgi:hypothetical protein